MTDPSAGPDRAPRARGKSPQSDGAIGRLADVLHSLVVHLYRVLRRVDAESGVNAAQLSALWTLLHGGPRTLRELAEAEQVSASTMTRLVQRLEALGLALRAPDPGDQRVVRVSATRRGQALLRAQRGRAVVELGRRVQAMTGEDVAAMERASRIVAALVRAELFGSRHVGRRPDGRGGRRSGPSGGAPGPEPAPSPLSQREAPDGSGGSP